MVNYSLLIFLFPIGALLVKNDDLSVSVSPTHIYVYEVRT